MGNTNGWHPWPTNSCSDVFRVLVTAGGEPSAFAAKTATSTIPHVFLTGLDPVQQGLVAAYNRPGGNSTGASGADPDDQFKRLGLLRALLPNGSRVAPPAMRRREFIAGLGGAAAMPLAVRAQQPKVARIGFLGLVSPASHAPRLAMLRAGLRDLGWIEGKNLRIEFRWAEGNYDRLPDLAQELVRLNIDVLVTHGAAGALAAKRATSTIPIVITAVGDMLALGLVASLSRPGGNITGLSLFAAELTAKRLELVKEAVPSLTKAAVLLNPDNASTPNVLQAIEATARLLNVAVQPFEVRRSSDFERVFANMADQQVGAIVVHEDTVLNANVSALAVHAAARRLPLSGFPELVRAGGLIAYGIDFPATDYRAAAFVDKILKGTSAADLPIERSTKFNVIVNIQTAKALGITVPPSLLARADEVIE